jgi:hypothetical protein
MTVQNFDLIVTGGGPSGCAAAISAARKGLKVLIVEQMGFLGGSATATYVTPMMKSALTDGTILGGTIYREVLDRMRQEGYAEVYSDGNPGWFAPEMMKFTLDEIMEEAMVKVLFHSSLLECQVSRRLIKKVNILTCGGLRQLSARYYIDATGDAALAAAAGVPFEVGKDGITQAMSHRFMMTGVEIDKFADWLEQIDPDKNVSPVYRTDKGEILLTTAYTSEDKPWALRPYFMEAIVNRLLKPYDADYFQLFTIPGQKGTVAFNCPRIYSKKPLSPLNPVDISYAQISGRKQIKRLAGFCNKYFPGFEHAYISNIAPNIGIRDSRRIKGKYTLTLEDIKSGKKFNNAVARCNYPVDVHSSSDNLPGGLTYLDQSNYYEIPLESLETNEIENMLVVGRSISAEFEAQASLRIQPVCWTMGESAGNIVAERLLSSQGMAENL